MLNLQTKEFAKGAFGNYEREGDGLFGGGEPENFLTPKRGGGGGRSEMRSEH